MAPMLTTRECGGLHEGEVYIDLDGTAVRLVRIIGDICCWVPVDKDWNDRQHTLAAYFRKRFRLDIPPVGEGDPGPVPGPVTAWKFSTGAGTFVVQQHEPRSTHHRVGERVPNSGVYLALHDVDLVTTDVCLRAGSVFPYCAKCGVALRFELMAEITPMEDGIRWVRDCQIHHPDLGSGTADSQHAA